MRESTECHLCTVGTGVVVTPAKNLNKVVSRQLLKDLRKQEFSSCWYFIHKLAKSIKISMQIHSIHGFCFCRL